MSDSPIASADDEFDDDPQDEIDQDGAPDALPEPPQFWHEMFDHPACQFPGAPKHDLTVSQYHCLACHFAAHSQYHQDIDEIVNGTVFRDEGHPEIQPNDPHHGPTRFLLIWHGTNGYCPILGDAA